MKTPKFWYKNYHNYLSLALYPISLLWQTGTILKKIKLKKKFRTNVPVICVGNIIAGGAGKTPVTIALAKALKNKNKKVHIIYKLFNTKIKSNYLKVTLKDKSCLVGDEPLLSSKIATTWVCKKRSYGIRAAVNDGAEIILLDDGFQDNTIHKDYSIMVINSKQGFGNKLLIPAGPLRERITGALNKADCIFFYGTRKDFLSLLPKCKIKTYFVKIRSTSSNLTKALKKKFIAFAGIAHPENFYSFLEKINIDIAHKISYPDHYQYKEKDFEKILNLSKITKTCIITTEKDYVKVPYKFKKNIYELSITIDFDIDSFLSHFGQKINELY